MSLITTEWKMCFIETDFPSEKCVWLGLTVPVDNVSYWDWFSFVKWVSVRLIFLWKRCLIATNFTVENLSCCNWFSLWKISLIETDYSLENVSHCDLFHSAKCVWFRLTSPVENVSHFDWFPPWKWVPLRLISMWKMSLIATDFTVENVSDWG